MVFANSAIPSYSINALEKHPGLEAAIARSERTIRFEDGSYFGEQPGKYRFGLSATGRLTVGNLALRTVAFGNGSHSSLAMSPQPFLGADESEFSKLTYRRPGLSEWYVNEGKSLHHWFKVDRKLNAGNLWIKLSTFGAEGVQAGQNKIEFETTEGSLTYEGLKVWDADGKHLPAKMQLRGSEIIIGVEDEGATYPVTIDPEWVEGQALVASDPGENHQFGWSVALDGDTAVIGAQGASDEGYANAGKAYIFTREGLKWREEAILGAGGKRAELNNFFGCSVAISKDTVIVGALGTTAEAGERAGSAYVFTRQDTEWTQQAVLIPSDSEKSAAFGVSVAVEGDTAVVGAPAATHNGAEFAGKAYVFERRDTEWVESDILNSELLKGQTRAFGVSVALRRDQLIVGAPDTTVDGFKYAGSAHIYTLQDRRWTEVAALFDKEPEDGGAFGYSVGVDKDHAIVGAPGSTFEGKGLAGKVWAYSAQDSIWNLDQLLTATEPMEEASFGQSVSFSGNTLLVGAPYERRRGGAAVFRRSDREWKHFQNLKYQDDQEEGYFGQSVAVRGDAMLVGAFGAIVKDVPYIGKVFSFNPELAVTFATSGVTGGKAIVGTISVTTPAAVDSVIYLSSDNPAVSVPASVSIPAGSDSVTFTATSSVVSVDTPVYISANGDRFESRNGFLMVRTPRVGAISFSAIAIRNGQSATGTVTLQSAAPTGGILVTLTNPSPSSLNVPATVLVAAGATRATFTVTGRNVPSAQSVRVVATPTFSEKSAAITVNPPALASVSVPDFLRGGSTTGTVVLEAAAPTGGRVVRLSSSSTGITVPDNVTISAGETSATFVVSSTKQVVGAVIQASSSGGVTVSDTVSTVYIDVTSVSSSSSQIRIGTNATVTVNLNSVTPVAVTVSVRVQKSGVLSAPLSLMIPAGSSSATFQVSGIGRGVSNVYAQLPAGGTKSAVIRVVD